MKKILRSSAIAALALAVAVSCPAKAQSAPAGNELPRHLAPAAVSPADVAAIHAHEAALAEAATIFGYNLEAGNWLWEQTLCPAMPGGIMLHYFQRFPDGTESLFTALVPRGTGRVRIVPILHRNKTPYLPAPTNPRNYAVFNEAVPPDIAARAIDPDGNALQLSTCYAEMTGGGENIPQDWGAMLTVNGPLLNIAHTERLENAIRVSFPDRESPHAYQFWIISFSRYGRITSVQTEDHTVYMAKSVPAGPPASTGTAVPAQPVIEPRPVQPEISQQPLPQPVNPSTQAVAAPAMHAAAAGTMPQLSPAETPEQMPAPEPGWKYILNPRPPKEKIIRNAPPPRERVVPVPPDPEEKPVPQNRSQQ